MSAQQSELLGLARDLENALANVYDTQAPGLHQKVNQVEALLPPDVTKKLRFVASIRNRVVHKSDVNEKTLGDVRSAASDALDYLATQQNTAVNGQSVPGVIAIVLFIAAALWCIWGWRVVGPVAGQ